jgi:hypothetical protein
LGHRVRAAGKLNRISDVNRTRVYTGVAVARALNRSRFATPLARRQPIQRHFAD